MEGAVTDNPAASAVIYRLLVNGHGQYALWPDGEPVPWGWQPTGKSGTKVDCVAYVAAQSSGRVAASD